MTDSPYSARIPTVKLDVPVITDSIAARLANTLLSHLLFLKSQVPLPVVILHKQRLTNTKVDKPRLELLNTLDVLSSHLDTTFTSLSTAYAKCKGGCWSSSYSENTTCTGSELMRPTYLAILIGPSISTAKVKVIFGVDGLEEKIWGSRDGIASRDGCAEDESDDAADDIDEDGSDEEISAEAGSSDDEDPEVSDSDDDEDEDAENEEEQEGQKEGITNPISSRPPSGVVKQPQVRLQESSSRSTQNYQTQTYADLQSMLQKADRLFSNTLARTEGEGRGMSSEMAPTRTHVLIRAPRRFKHPAWIPRQNMDRVMDRAVREFEESRDVQEPPEEETTQTGRKLRGRGFDKSKVEGVWVTSSSLSSANVPSYNNLTFASRVGEENEENEMIWWSWEREVVGFN
ncbi:hypothetical protein L218DRAFT_279935 [Marasmius fiardii PR-910]|nr:hypothetical protein L218DRAFT_279935 [Marasmius fiardii PR-910]